MEKLKHPHQHWTSTSIENFVFQIASDFTLQLEKKLEAGPLTHKEFANRLGITAGRVSQVFNNPGNFKLTSMAEYARTLGLKVAVVAYDDADPENTKGPINAEVFYECWKRLGRPQDFFDLHGTDLVIHPVDSWTQPIDAGTNTKAVRLVGALGDKEWAPSIIHEQKADTRNVLMVQ